MKFYRYRYRHSAENDALRKELCAQKVQYDQSQREHVEEVSRVQSVHEKIIQEASDKANEQSTQIAALQVY